jgi:chromosome segregation ATPase
MDAKLHNAYVEVLLDNFISVIKQNIMFQTQINVVNEKMKETENIKNQLEDLKKRNVDLQLKLDELYKNNNELKSSVDGKQQENNLLENLKREKDRIQSALNDHMREVKVLKSDLEGKNSTLETQNKYIEKLENLFSQSKLKKIKSEDATQSTTPEVSVEVKSGGVF